MVEANNALEIEMKADEKLIDENRKGAVVQANLSLPQNDDFTTEANRHIDQRNDAANLKS